MIENVPLWLNALFIAAAIFTLILFYFASGKAAKLIGAIIIWSVLHSFLAYYGFYTNTTAFPPRLLFLLAPLIVLFIYGLQKKQRTLAIKNWKIEVSIWLHSVRIGVEVVLYYLFVYKMVPELMTFNGRNFDILIGLSAPIIALLWWKKLFSKRILLLWNIVGLCFVLFILINGILSAEMPFQLFGFDQPNRGIAFFPYILLPATIVPIVVYSHIISIYKLKNW